MKLLKKTVLTFAILFAGLCFATVAAPAITSYAAVSLSVLQVVQVL